MNSFDNNKFIMKINLTLLSDFEKKIKKIIQKGFEPQNKIMRT